MGKSFAKRKLQEKRIRLSTAGYIIPFSVSVVMIILFAIPCLYFTDYSGDAKTLTSVFTRIFENFSAARKVLLDPSVEDAAYKSFSSFTLTACVVSLLLMLLGALVSAAYTVVGLFHIFSDEKSSNLRRVFVTVIPNKAVICCFTALTAVPALFPHVLVKTIDRTLMIYTEVHFVAGDLLIYCAILSLLPIIYFIVTRRFFTDELDIFSKQKKSKNSDSEKEYEQSRDNTNEVDNTTADENDDIIRRMSRITKEEQEEKIRKLLDKSRSEENNNDKA